MKTGLGFLLAMLLAGPCSSNEHMVIDDTCEGDDCIEVEGDGDGDGDGDGGMVSVENCVGAACDDPPVCPAEIGDKPDGAGCFCSSQCASTTCAGTCFTGAATYFKADEATAHDYFGSRAVLYGATLAVSAPREDGPGGLVTDAGAVYIFGRSGNTWTQRAYLQGTQPEHAPRFGESLALDGDTVVAGTQAQDSCSTDDLSTDDCLGSGVVYVFERSGESWSQSGLLKSDNIDTDDHFGAAVAVQGDTLVVGAPREASCSGADSANDECQYSGAAYVFTKTEAGWVQTGYLKAPDPSAQSSFGNAVAIHHNRIAVGAYGKAFTFTRPTDNDWLFEAEVDDGLGNFGRAVGLYNDTLAVGDFRESSCADGVSSCPGAGAVFVYTRGESNWDLQQMLKADNANPHPLDGGEPVDTFGVSVELHANEIIVGAVGEGSCAKGVDGDGDDNECPYSGAAYIFSRAGGNWTQAAYIKATNTSFATAGFGTAVSMSGDYYIVAADREDNCNSGINPGQGTTNCYGAGAVYSGTVPR